MTIEFERCLERRRLIKMKIEKDIIKKEFEESKNDFNKCKKTFEEQDYKWTIVKAYYSMFHSAKALVYYGGYREKSHYCLMIALESLYVETNKIEGSYVDMFKDVMRLREDADYGMIYSENAAKMAVSNVGKFIEKTKEILKEFL